MLTLNLLPTRQKHEVRVLRILQLAKSILALLLLVAIISSLVVIAAHTILEVNYWPMVARVGVTAGRTRDFDREVRELNARIKAIEEIQKEKTYWSEVFVSFTQCIPPGIQMTEIRLDKVAKSVFIRGKAKTREDLIGFQKNLEAFPVISDIKAPLSNLLFPTDVDFRFEGKLNLEKQPKIIAHVNKK